MDGFRAEKGTGFWKNQQPVENFYTSKRVQILVAAMIVANFGIQCLSKQLDPRGTEYTTIWAISEDFFNIVFLTELMVNMYGTWMLRFFKSHWNKFDLLVVAIGVLDLCRAPLPGPLKLVRMLRAFRVFRLFGRIEALKRILIMIHRAIPGVMAAFVLNFIVLCIYSVLSVDFFREIHDDCHEVDLPVPTAITARGKCFGRDYYGNFLRALYTFFQCLTGESWSEAAVRPVLEYFEGSTADTFGTSVFFISFYLVNAIVLLNVVVAVLIDGMSGGVAEEVSEEVHGDEAKKQMGPYEEMAQFQSEMSAEVRVAQDDISGMKEDINSLEREIKEQTSAISQALKDCRPRKYMQMGIAEDCRPRIVL